MNDYSKMTESTPVVLVEFFATWCPHCQRMAPVVADVADALKGKVDVYRFDIDKNDSLASQENVESVPTFIIYSGGHEVWRHTGEMTEAALLGELREAANMATV